MANRLFSKPKPRELMTDPQSSGGSYRLTSSADLIAYHRRLKNRTLTNWPARIHRILNVFMFLSFLGIFCGVWMAAKCCNQSDSARAEGCFTVAVCASVAFACCVLVKCYWNSRHPQN